MNDIVIRFRILLLVLVNYFLQIVNLYFNLNNFRVFDCRQTNKASNPLVDYNELLKDLD